MSETTNLKLFKHDNPSTNENQFNVKVALNDNWDILDDFAGDVNDKTTEIEDNMDGQAENIQALQSEMQELEEDIQSNAIIEETEQAKSLYIDDASGARGSLSVEGNNEQEVQEGTDNLAVLEDGVYKKNGLKISIEDGNIAITGTSTAYTEITIGTAYLISGKTYYIKKSRNGGGVRIQNSSKQYWFTDAESSIIPDITGKWNIIASSATNQTLSFTTKISISETPEADFIEGKAPMPSPQYPSEIKVLETGNTEIKKTGKNIMPILNLGTNWEYTDRGIKNLAKNEGISITKINLKKGQTVKIGFKLFSKPTASASFTGYIEGKENTNIQFNSIQNFNLNQTYTRTYTATEDCSLTYTLWGNANSDTFEFQMWAELDTLTDYEQYKEEVYNLDIQQEMLKGDYFIKEADVWKEVHLRAKRNIKEDITNAILSSTNNFIYVSNLLQNTAKLVENTEDANVMSNIAQHSSQNDMSNANIDYGIGISKVGSLTIRIKDFTTLEEYKAALTNDSFYYYYYLATPTKLVCTDAQIEVLEKLNKLRFYKGVNNIFTTEDIALLQAKYSVDIQTKINNVISTQLNQIGGNQNV